MNSDTSFVYVLTNAAMPGLVKIGMTTRDDPEYRAQELYSTGVPVPFDVEFAGRVTNAAEVEAALHIAFEDKRVNPKREFFRIEPHQPIAVLKLLNVEDATDLVASELNSGVSDTEKRASKALTSRRPPLNFEEMGIPIGSQLHFTKDNDVTVEVVEAKKVLFDTEVVAISAATKALLEVGYYVRPTPYWEFDGRSLEDIYNETYPVSVD